MFGEKISYFQAKKKLKRQNNNSNNNSKKAGTFLPHK